MGEWNVNDIIRTCFPCNRHGSLVRNDNNDRSHDQAEQSDDGADDDNETGNDSNKLRNQYYKAIKKELTNQVMVIRGHDLKKRCIVYKMPRLVLTEETDINAYVMTQLYIAERTMATLEYLTKGE